MPSMPNVSWSWLRSRVWLRLLGLAVLSLGLLQTVDVRAAPTSGTVVAWGCGKGYDDFGQCDVPNGLIGVTAIAAGAFHSLALKGDGTVVAGGCGDGGGDSGQCTVPSGLTGVAAIGGGAIQSLALRSDGTVVAWGCRNGGGACSLPSGLTDVTAIAAGFYHDLALRDDGTVVAWGCDESAAECSVPGGLSGVTAIAAGFDVSLALVASKNRPPDCAGVTAAPDSIWPQMRDQFQLITLSGATDPDGDTLSYHIDSVTQDEYVTGVGDDSSPDAALTRAGGSSNQVLIRSEANSHYNGRVYRIAYTVSDGKGGSCAGTAGAGGNTNAKLGVRRRKDAEAIDDGGTNSWNSFTGAPAP